MVWNPPLENIGVLSYGGEMMPQVAAIVDAQRPGLKLIADFSLKNDRKKRILEALGAGDGSLPKVNEKTHFRYCRYLSTNLLFPFPAYYPEPTSTLEEDLQPCIVFELLSSAKCIGDEYDGIVCKTSNGTRDILLPLIELELPEDSPNFQMIEDYWYWFWNWR